MDKMVLKDFKEIKVNSLVNTITLQPGHPDCDYGGVMIEVGTDDNNNGMLESFEVDSTEYVCDGVGMDSLVNTLTILPGHPNCDYGGVMIEVGTDDNDNGMLESFEVDSTEYVCDGVGMDSLVNTLTILPGHPTAIMVEL